VIAHAVALFYSIRYVDWLVTTWATNDRKMLLIRNTGLWPVILRSRLLYLDLDLYGVP
jgi:hypothetical protein